MTNVDEQLRRAASDGNLSGVIEALTNGADINARGEYGDTALNEAAEYGHIEVVKHLIESGADIHNLGGADKTPIMNAAFAGHVPIVRLLLEHGATINNDLLSSVQLKVNILEENAEAGMVRSDAVDAWRGFLNFLIAARLKQDLPEIIEGLSSQYAAERKNALERVESAVNRGVDISAAVSRLAEMLSSEDAEVRGAASAALSMHYARSQTWDRLRELFETGDEEVNLGAIPALVYSARDKLDVSPMIKTMINLLSESSLNLRHDAAIALGYAATNGIDVSSALPEITRLLSDPQPEARKMAAWALYRIAKYICDISAAVPALRSLSEDEDEGVREMAAEASRMNESREK
ncbi:MAG: HEAT repeat domain-containing protein [Acidobacteriota bacterium]